MRILLAAIVTVLLLGGMAAPSLLALPGQPAAAAAAIDASDRAPASAAAVREEPGASGVLMLCGFLGLIAGLLAHWSRDTSCRDDRSVFQSKTAA